MARKTLIPAAERLVIDPETMKVLPAEGAEVEVTSYWLRRLKDGDVTEATAKQKKQATTSTTAGT